MTDVCIPIEEMAYTAYFNAREERTFEFEGPDDTSWIVEFRSKRRMSQIVENVESGEWTGECVELEGTIELDSGWIVKFELEYYPSEDNNAHAFFYSVES